MITVTLNDAAFRTYLRDLQDRMGDLTRVMDAIGQVVAENAKGRFETRTDPNGQPWKPWAPSTRETYPFPGSPYVNPEDGPGNGKLLDRYGTMLSGLNHQATTDSVRIGFAEPYSTYHELGTRTMPRRGLLMGDPNASTLGATDEAAVVDIVSSWVANLAN